MDIHKYICMYSHTHIPFPKVRNLKQAMLIHRGKNCIIPASKGSKNLKRIKET